MHLGINPFKNRNIDENVLFVLYAIFVMSLPYSKSFISIFSGLIFLISLFFSLKNRSFMDKLSSDYSWTGMVAIFCVYLIGLFFTKDIKIGFYELNKEINWVLLSLGLFLAPKMPKKNIRLLFFLFVFGVTVSTFFSFFKMFFAPVFGIGNFREVNYISHIPFSFQISFSIFILIYTFIEDNFLLTFKRPIIKVIWIVWLLFFLIVLKSILGLLSFYITSIFLIFYIFKSGLIKKGKKWMITGIVIFYLIPLLYIGNVIYSFYTIKDPKIENVEKFTKQGNEYNYNLTLKYKENGHFVYWFVCEKELKESWNSRSKYEFYGLNDKGYLISETLIRYMTSKGLKKDAEDFQQLTDRDIRNIEAGIANYIYDAPAYAIYPRIYETVWEIDKYFLTGDPNDQSLSQRIEFSKAAFLIIKKHFLFGTGTGNFREVYHNTYLEMGSKLRQNNYGIAHNQYLSYWIKFGIVGLIFILCILIFLAYKKKLFKSGLFVLFFVNLLIANLGDTNWETHVGLAFFVFFFSIFLWHTDHDLEQSE